jgi:hypothetical protein
MFENHTFGQQQHRNKVHFCSGDYIGCLIVRVNVSLSLSARDMREKMPSPKSLFILHLQWISTLQQHSIATSKWELEACPSHCRPAAVRSSTVNFSSDSSGFRTLCTLGHFFHIHFNFKMRAFWDIAPCILVEVDGRFTGPYCLHHQVLPPISARISKFVSSIKCPN